MSGEPVTPTHLDLRPDLALPVAFYARPVDQVAVDLLGAIVVSTVDGMVAGTIVETEAYGGADDPASHAAFRRTGVVRQMWGDPGRLYIYRAYGVYPCLNVVTGSTGELSAVLIRAVNPIWGIDVIAERLGKPVGPRMMSGPGLTGRALGLSLADNGRRLDEPPIWIQPAVTPSAVRRGPRIGVRRATDTRWRFGVADHPALSPPFPGESANL